MAARSRKAATPKAQPTQAQPEDAVKWLDTWRNNKAKITLFAFNADNKLCVKVTTPDDEPMFLNSGDLEAYLDSDASTIRGWMGDAQRFGSTVQAALDSYLTERGWKSASQSQAEKQDRLAALGL